MAVPKATQEAFVKMMNKYPLFAMQRIEYLKEQKKKETPSQTTYVYPKPSSGGRPSKPSSYSSQSKSREVKEEKKTYTDEELRRMQMQNIPWTGGTPPSSQVDIGKQKEWSEIVEKSTPPDEILETTANIEYGKTTRTATPYEIPSSIPGSVQKAHEITGTPGVEPVEILSGETYKDAMRYKFKPSQTSVPAGIVKSIQESKPTGLSDEQLLDIKLAKKYHLINPYTGEPEWIPKSEYLVYFGYKPRDEIGIVEQDLFGKKEIAERNIGVLSSNIEQATSFKQTLPEIVSSYETLKNLPSGYMVKVTEKDITTGEMVTREYTREDALKKFEDYIGFAGSEIEKIPEYSEKLSENKQYLGTINRAINYYSKLHELGYGVYKTDEGYLVKPPETKEVFEYLYGKQRADIIAIGSFSKSLFSTEMLSSTAATLLTGDKKYIESEIEGIMKQGIEMQKYKKRHGFGMGLVASIASSPAVQTGTMLLAAEAATPLIATGAGGLISKVSTEAIPKASELVGKLPGGVRTIVSTGAKIVKYAGKSFGKVISTKPGGFLLTADLYAAIEIPHLAEVYQKTPERLPAELGGSLVNWSLFSLAVGEGMKIYQSRRSIASSMKQEIGALKIDQNVKLTNREFTPEQLGIKVSSVAGEPTSVSIKEFVFSGEIKNVMKTKQMPVKTVGRGWVLTTDKPVFVEIGGKQLPLSKGSSYVYGRTITPLYESEVNPLYEIQQQSRQFFKVSGKTDFEKFVSKRIGTSYGEFSGIGKFEKLGEKGFVFKTHGLSHENLQIFFERGGIVEKPVDLVSKSRVAGIGEKTDELVISEWTPSNTRRLFGRWGSDKTKLVVGSGERSVGLGVSENVYEKNLLLFEGKTISKEQEFGKLFKKLSSGKTTSGSSILKFEREQLEQLVGHGIAGAAVGAKVGEETISLTKSIVSSGVVTVGGAGNLGRRVSLRKLEEWESGIGVSSRWKQPSVSKEKTMIGSDIRLLGIEKTRYGTVMDVGERIGEVPLVEPKSEVLLGSEETTIGATIPSVSYESLVSQETGQKLGSRLKEDVMYGGEEFSVTVEPIVETPHIITPYIPPFFFLESEEKRKPKQLMKKKQIGYNVFVKNKQDSKEYIRVNRRPLTREDALSMGATIVDETTSAVFKIKPSKGKPGKPSIRAKPFLNLRKKFYEEKPNTFVEKKTHRVDTVGEQLGVSARDWLGGRKPLKLFKKKKQKNEYKRLSRRLI
ncbi:hypothetical protein DRH29_03120 [candidate division Kazan bacterium]|uniref:Uncharacterized protein n=1 Tax=candidate division Kazan bacterium TaxID=2202143 RepID=A0A420ZCG7_UNCK3|nr:MAG: hypothetical protein DRH29_03120 [candidate division Kazan bacterium]